MPRYELEDHSAIVTGGGRGIGRACAIRLAEEGASVAVVDIDGQKAADVADQISNEGGRAVAFAADVTAKNLVEDMVLAAKAELGSLDVLVASAGVLSLSPALDLTEEDWDRHMAVNAKGVLFCSQAAARQMIAQGSGGRIIVIASTAGRLPASGDTHAAAYVASKHAVMGLVKQMGLELATHGILMNAVLPGIVDTEMVRQMQESIAMQGDETYEEVRARFEELIPLGGYQTAEDVAGLVAFLASSDASHSIGQAFDASGGIAFH